MSDSRASVEDRIDAVAHWAHGKLPRTGISTFFIEFLVFGIKQAWACMFAGLLLAFIIATAFYYPQDAWITRYDFLLLVAVAIQIGMLLLKLETLDEAKVILIYHVVGTVMEIFKTYMDSWIYPEDSFFRIGGVPLYSGFMYAAIGSYIARVWRIFDFGFSNYPPIWVTYVLAIAIYVNFFTHHFIWDFRWLLFGAVFLAYGRTCIHFSIFRFRLWGSLVVGFFLVALFIWFAENIGSYSKAWLYPHQMEAWSLVGLAKMGSWYLLMIISFVLVTIIHPPRKEEPIKRTWSFVGVDNGRVAVAQRLKCSA